MPNNNFPKIASGSPMLLLSAEDLREVVRELFKEQEQRTAAAIEAHRELPTLTRDDAARALNVSLSTLWRWEKIGYLKPVRIGTKVLYRATDIDGILHTKKPG